MDRDRQHIVAMIEDLLGAVAVMGIHVEDRDPVEAAFKTLGRDRSVVDVAEAARPVRPGVMSGWPAQGVCETLAGPDRIRRRDRAFAGPQGRAPGLRPDRHREIAHIPAHLAHEVAGGTGRARHLLRAAVPVGKGVRPDFGTPIGQMLPARPDRLQEIEIRHRMHGFDGSPSMRLGRLGLNAVPRQGREQPVGPDRKVLRRDDPAEAQELLRIVKRLIGMMKGAHGRRSRG